MIKVKHIYTNTCRPGQLSEEQENLEINFGREVNNGGVSRPRPSGGIRGQGKWSAMLDGETTLI